MKKIILTLYIFFVSSTLIFAQEFWSEQSSGVFTPLTSASAAPLNVGWICGFNGIVLRTINGGINWSNVSGNGIPGNRQLTNIFGFDNLNALTCGNTSNETFVYRTTNGGTSWQQVFTQLNGYMEAIWMKDAQNGFMFGDAVGNRWSLWKTTNGGATWDSSGLYLSNTFTDEYGWNNSMYLNNNSIWFGTTNNKIYYSSNYGASWTAQSSPSITIFSIYMAPPSFTTGYACGAGLIKTTDGGSSWTSLTIPGSGFYSAITAASSVYFVRGNTAYVSVNSGSTWTPQHTAPNGSFRHISHRSVNGINLMYSWAVRDNGGISKWQLSTPVQQISSVVPEHFSLSQNYPNPFNPTTKIKFAVSLSHLEGGRGMIRLVIYDVLGREIAALVNEQLTPGTYEAEWDGSNFSSGIYYYTLQTESYTETRKMVLIK